MKKEPEKKISAEKGGREARGKRALLMIFMTMWLSVMLFASWAAVHAWRFSGRWAADSPVRIALSILLAALVFNLAYLIGVLAWRVIIPYPREGFFRVRPDGRPRPEQQVFLLNVLLSKLRYGVPWSGPVLGVLCRMPPLGGLYRRLFHPHFHAMTLGDTFTMIDPALVHAHPTSQIGFGSTLTCHLYDTRGLFVKRITIDAHAVIGGLAVLAPGVHVGEHAVVDGGAIVSPNTMIKPYEQWGGYPARKIRDIPRPKPK